jgi:hypothetical protein
VQLQIWLRFCKENISKKGKNASWFRGAQILGECILYAGAWYVWVISKNLASYYPIGAQNFWWLLDFWKFVDICASIYVYLFTYSFIPLTVSVPVPVGAGYTVRIPSGAWLFVVSGECCQVEVSTTSWSLVHKSPIDCGVSLCVIWKPREWGSPGPMGAVTPKTNKTVSLL